MLKFIIEGLKRIKEDVLFDANERGYLTSSTYDHYTLRIYLPKTIEGDLDYTITKTF